jgi:predicted PurR-regulated permease PerM
LNPNPPQEDRRVAAQRGRKASSVSLVILAVCAVTALLYFGRAVFVPLGIALVFTSLLRPVVRWLEGRRLPTSLASTLVVLASLGLLAGGGMLVAGPVQEMLKQAPSSIATVRSKLRHLTRSVEPVAGALNPAGAGGGAPARSTPTPRGTVNTPGVEVRIVTASMKLVGSVVSVLLLTWFLLASGNLFPRKLFRLLPFPWEKQTAHEVLDDIESVVSGYMFVTLLINIGQGTAVGLTMWALGMPTPLLWGMLTLLLEFIPYLGAAFMMVLLTVMGLATFRDPLHGFAAPAAYLVITTLQNNLVSPVAYGRRLRLNPVAVLVGVLVWWTLWGVPGAFLAVPIIATAKVMGDHLVGLHAVGEMLGD